MKLKGPLPLAIGLRYIRAKRKTKFISFISFSSTVGLAIGVFALIVVLSVMNGLAGVQFKRLFHLVPHATVEAQTGPLSHWQEKKQALLASKNVEGVSPYIDSIAMIKSGNEVRPVQLFGIDPKQQSHVTDLQNILTLGSLDDLENNDPPHIFLGQSLANALGLYTGDKITVMVPQTNANGQLTLPEFKSFELVGTFFTGSQIDYALAYISLSQAQQLKGYQPNEVQGLQLKLSDYLHAPALVRTLPLASDDTVTTWTQTFSSLYKAIKMEKMMTGILLFLIVTVAIFNILSSLVMMVTDKQSDIAILRTMGASPNLILLIFIVQGSFTSFIGTLVGGTLGYFTALNISSVMGWFEKVFNFAIFDASVFSITGLPSDVRLHEVFTICGTALLLSFIITLYPATRAAKIQPAMALQYKS